MPSYDDQNNKFRHDRFHGRVRQEGTICHVEDCQEAGEFRAPNQYAPRTHDGPPPAMWLCLTHIRAFNASYDYFSGMSEDEIYEAQHPATGWDANNRWPNGSNPPPRWSDFTDPLDAIGAKYKGGIGSILSDSKPENRADTKALKVMGLKGDVSRSDIRKKYGELLRRYHPDRNGGDRSHEKALQDVISAYTHLKASENFK